MKLNIGSLIIIAAALLNVSACSYIKGLFPDKEKDYQFTTEIKPLVLPSDLSDNSVLKQAEAPAAPAIATGKTDAMQADAAPDANADLPPESEPAAVEQVQSESVSQTTEPAVEDSEAGPPSEREPAADEQASEDSGTTAEAAPVEQPAKQQTQKNDDISVKLVVYDDGESRLRIAADTIIAWRMVGKALSRKSIEVISRNQDEASYEVQYDPDEKRVEDGSLWDEAVFIFGGFNTNEKRYLLKCVGNNQQTDVAVLDQDGKPVVNGAGLRLLKLIQTTLKADQSK